MYFTHLAAESFTNYFLHTKRSQPDIHREKPSVDLATEDANEGEE
jgi:hypothetical protein